MYKNAVLFLAGVVFFSFFHLACAEVVINEIMYAPTNGSDYEWVEIFNSGSVSMDLQGWRFFHGANETSSTSGPLTLRNGSTTVLQPSEYAIIAKSPSVVTDYTWLNFSGMILSASTLSLPDGADNTYIAVASDTNKTIINSVTYDTDLGGSKDSGNSLSKINNSWTNGTPTPGALNQSPASPAPTGGGALVSSDSDNSSSQTQNTSATETKSKVAEEPQIKTQIIAKNLVFTGTPISFQASTAGSNKEKMFYGKYFWNFGDGDSKETQTIESKPFTHTYFYPGDYLVTLEYSLNSYSDAPDASDQIMIKAVSADISISAVGSEQDFFVELSNNIGYDADISNWILGSAARSFTFPKDTIISSKKKITISPSLTHFSILDKDTLKLMTPQGKIVFDYASSITPIIPVEIVVPLEKKSAVSVPESVPAYVPDVQIPPKPKTDPNTDKPAENLEAAALSSDVVSENFPFMPAALAVLFIGSSAGAVYFIRQKKLISKIGDDFDIEES